MQFEKIERNDEEKRRDLGNVAFLIGILAGIGGYKISGDVLSFFKKEKGPITNLSLKVLQLYFANKCADMVYADIKKTLLSSKDEIDKIKVEIKEISDGGSKD